MPQFACVPNISEGRNKSVIESIAAVVDSTRGVKLLDITSDVEMNRTVMTFLGRQPALKRATISLMERAIKQIDIRKHEGRHPRIGIVDVIPFVPLNDTPIEKAVQLARGTAKLISEHFSLPVYLYGHAAKRFERISLDHIREGEFEGFAKKIKVPEWKPDFGPAKVHNSAGVTCVGARYPLVAFNAFIKAKNEDTVAFVVNGLELKWPDRQQIRFFVSPTKESRRFKISVTIQDSKSIEMYTIIEAIKEELLKTGCQFLASELVGLVTGDALYSCLRHYLSLQNFKPSQIVDFHTFKADRK